MQPGFPGGSAEAEMYLLGGGGLAGTRGSLHPPAPPLKLGGREGSSIRQKGEGAKLWTAWASNTKGTQAAPPRSAKR